jgi:anti-sigma B factor antagonist
MDISKSEIKPGIFVLRLTGRIFMGHDCQLIRQEIEQHMGRNENRFIFDLSGAHYIDSAAVGEIVRCFTRLAKSGGALRLAGAKGMVEGAFRLTQVDRVIGMYPTVLEASESFPSA